MAEQPAETYVADFMASRDGLQLVKAFLAIEDVKVRRRIIDLVETLAGEKR